MMYYSIGNYVSKLIKSNLVKYLFIPSLLITIWMLLSILYNSYGVISVLTYANNVNKDRIDLHFKEILKGDVVNGSFQAEDDNLGIVSVRFNTFQRINGDVVRFFIKERNENKWYYTNLYKVDQFQPNDFFTFGFPLIKNSKNKQFNFRIQSTKGESGDAVAISSIEPTFVKKYQFTKSELLPNKKLLVEFFFKKFLNSFNGPNFVASSLIYLFPLVLYVFWLFPIQPSLKYLYNKHSYFRKFVQFIITGALMTLIFGSTILVNELTSIWAVLILIFSWIYINHKYKYGGNSNYYICLLLLIITPILLKLNLFIRAERAGIWIYYFFIIGFLQNLVTYFLLKRKSI